MKTIYKTKLEIISDTEIRTSRVIEVPKKLVFKAFSTPEMIEQWYGPKKFKTVVEKLDFREGGEWRFLNIEEAEGVEHAFSGIFKEIKMNERIVQTSRYEPMPDMEMIEEVDFIDENSNTRIESRITYPSKEAMVGMMQGGSMEAGMNESYDRLETLLENQQE